jgi:hypothetical protein
VEDALQALTALVSSSLRPPPPDASGGRGRGGGPRPGRIQNPSSLSVSLDFFCSVGRRGRGERIKRASGGGETREGSAEVAAARARKAVWESESWPWEYAPRAGLFPVWGPRSTVWIGLVSEEGEVYRIFNRLPLRGVSGNRFSTHRRGVNVRGIN